MFSERATSNSRTSTMGSISHDGNMKSITIRNSLPCVSNNKVSKEKYLHNNGEVDLQYTNNVTYPLSTDVQEGGGDLQQSYYPCYYQISPPHPIPIYERQLPPKKSLPTRDTDRLRRDHAREMLEPPPSTIQTSTQGTNQFDLSSPIAEDEYNNDEDDMSSSSGVYMGNRSLSFGSDLGGVQRTTQPRDHKEKPTRQLPPPSSVSIPSETIAISDDVRLASLVPASTAEARSRTAHDVDTYSYGDRVAYTARRLGADRQTQSMPARCYYAAAQIGDTLYLHGGCSTSTLLAQNACSDWHCINIRQLKDSICCSEESTRTHITRTKSSGNRSKDSQDTTAVCKAFTTESPAALAGHTAVAFKDRIFIYGGVSPDFKSLFSEVYMLDVSQNHHFTAIETSVPKPPGRARHAAAVHGHTMFIHGGHCCRSEVSTLQDFWAFDMKDGTWTTMSTPGGIDMPPRRYGHHAAVWKDYFFIAFGCDGKLVYNDIWAFCIKTRKWHLIIPRGKEPPERCRYGSAVVAGRRWIFHGGYGKNNTMDNAIYEFSFDSLEGRLLRVETATNTGAAKPKLLPALGGHCLIPIANSKLIEYFILGGINRNDIVSRVVYYVNETGQDKPRLGKIPTIREKQDIPKRSLNNIFAQTSPNASPARSDVIPTDAMTNHANETELLMEDLKARVMELEETNKDLEIQRNTLSKELREVMHQKMELELEVAEYRRLANDDDFRELFQLCHRLMLRTKSAASFSNNSPDHSTSERDMLV